MDLLERLQKQAAELWTKATTCKSDREREQILKQYREAYAKFLQQRRWLQQLTSDFK